ncbi:MAG TPA: hypothetical protein VFM43_05110 [Gaiellaceae bacterium]|nr:hypothetical protein [Gaiellaceae bacterium]
MKRFLMLVAVATVAAAMYVAAAPGGQQSTPTAKQFAALKKQVGKLSKSLTAVKKDEGNVKKLAVAEAGLILACMSQTVPVDQFGDGTNHTQGFLYSTDALEGSDTVTTALDATASTDTNAVWFVGGDSTCQTALQRGELLRHDAAEAGVSLRPASAGHAFVAHRP